MRPYQKLLAISYKDHVTNEKVRWRIQGAIGMHDDRLKHHESESMVTSQDPLL